LQRAWIAMVLAQETDIICLDEPVNHLDMAHQLECLELVTRLNKERGRTIVLVLHDLNLAARYADQLVFVSDGKIRDSGPAEIMMRSDLIAEVFNIGAEIITDPVHHRPMCIPFRRQ
jgi:iron complex transport system ATP-binding protein